MTKIYKKERNVFHNIVYGMLIFLTVAIVMVWIYKGAFPVQAIAGYGIVLSYAVMFRSNKTYVEMDDYELRIINAKDSKFNKSFNLDALESIFIKRASVEGYALEIRVGNRITSCTVSLIGKTEKEALVVDLMSRGIKVIAN